MNILRILPLLALLTAIPAAAQGTPKNVEVDRIVAVVNDEVITQFDLDSRLRQVEQQLRRQGTPLPARQVLERQMLERLIVDRVQLQLARESGLRIDEAQLDSALTRIAEQNRMSLADFRRALEADGIGWEKFRREIRDEMTIVRLREREVENRIAVSEGEIDNYLASPEAKARNEEYEIAHILLRVPEQANPEQLARIGARAEEALRQLRGGADFAQVAAAYSDAPDALNGGDMGWRAPDRLPALFAEQVAKMQPGEVSDILRSPAGLHIMRLTNRRGGLAPDQKIQQTHARHILIRINELVSSDEARRKLVDLKERLANGADFAELARLYSNDLSAARGGDLGWLYPGDTVPEFERAMNALKPGEISAPVQSPFGWHLIQLVARRVETASDERQRLMARAALRDRKSDEAYQDWLRQMRDRAYVEYRLEEK